VGGVACVIPALDAARTLASVVRGVRDAIPGVRVIVVDDGSGDRTADVAAACADGLERFARNQGKGAALRAGFAWALDGGATTIITMDADGQHDPAAAPRLVAALSAADIVIGTRRRRGTGMPIVRRASNAVSAAAVSLCAGQRLADSQSGFRALRARVLAHVDAAGDRYEYETDFLIQAARAGLRIACVPVPTIYGAPSHFRALRDTARVLRTIWRGLPVGVRRPHGRAAGAGGVAGQAAPMAVAGPPAAAT
jgi:glycosyltransferase involved in cell wall biosynthesis